MAHQLCRFITVVAGVFALCGIGYYVLCVWSVRRFLNHCRSRTLAAFTPPVSILKPLRGTDPGMYDALRSHCRQDYPDFELIFGVADADDPAVELVEQLQREFPQHRIELVVCGSTLGANLKVSNLVQMLPHARYGHILVNDSDICVESDYLRRVLAPFAHDKVGMVTSLYRAVGGRSLGARLEALGISTDFAAGVLAARQVEGIRFALGSTLAFSRRSLKSIGGFAPLLDYLADDFELGNRIAKAGYEVVLSEVVVNTHLPDYDFAGYWNHQLRWARTVRAARRWGYLGLALTFGPPWALVALVFSHAALWATMLLALTIAARLVMAVEVGRDFIGDPKIPADLWLLPLRDVIALLIWMYSYAGHTIDWRGDRFTLEDGKLKAMQPVESES